MLLDRVAHGQHEDVARAAGLGNDVGDLGLLDRRLAGAQAARDLDRRPAPMRRGMGMGGSTMPLLGWPSGPMSLWRTVSPKNRPNQCGGSSLPFLKLAGSMSNVQGGTAHGHQADIVLDRAHPADPGPQGLHRFVHPARHAFVPSLVAGNRHARRRFSNKEGPAFAGPSMIRKIAADQTE